MLDAINFWTLKNQHPLHMSQQGTFFIDKYIKYKCHIRMSTALASLSLLRQKHNTVTHACFLCYLLVQCLHYASAYVAQCSESTKKSNLCMFTDHIQFT